MIEFFIAKKHIVERKKQSLISVVGITIGVVVLMVSIGIAKKLKEVLPNIKTFPVEPLNSPLLSKGYIGNHKIQGMGMSTGKIPSVYDKTLADNIFTASCESAFDITKTLALKEGILVGISTGAVLSCALEFSKNNPNKNLNIVVLSTDSGEKYLSSNVF